MESIESRASRIRNELENQYIFCPKCSTKYSIDDFSILFNSGLGSFQKCDSCTFHFTNKFVTEILNCKIEDLRY